MSNIGPVGGTPPSNYPSNDNTLPTPITNLFTGVSNQLAELGQKVGNNPLSPTDQNFIRGMISGLESVGKALFTSSTGVQSPVLKPYEDDLSAVTQYLISGMPTQEALKYIEYAVVGMPDILRSNLPITITPGAFHTAVNTAFKTACNTITDMTGGIDAQKNQALATARGLLAICANAAAEPQTQDDINSLIKEIGLLNDSQNEEDYAKVLALGKEFSAKYQGGIDTQPV